VGLGGGGGGGRGDPSKNGLLYLPGQSGVKERGTGNNASRGKEGEKMNETVGKGGSNSWEIKGETVTEQKNGSKKGAGGTLQKKGSGKVCLGVT